MSEQPEELDFEERRKRLEQLFAAEPHLSPTMRARQLYDEPGAQSNGHHELEATTPSGGSNFTNGVNGAPTVSRTSEDTESVRPDGVMSISAARAELRQRASPSSPADREQDGLDLFRDSILNKWRRDILSDR